MSSDIAVVIPAHNAGNMLPAALDSLRQQTLQPKEVVVVDDGSIDDTPAVAERYGVKLLQQAQAGPAAARNRGIEATTSPLIAFLDADDWFAPTKLERQAARLHELDAQAVCCDAWLVEGYRVVRSKNEPRDVAAVLTLENLLQGNSVICSTMMLRRQALDVVGLFDEHPDLVATEDYDLWLRLARREPIAYMSDPLAYYRVHAGSLTSNQRFMRGVDRIMARLERDYAEEPHFRKLLQRRRAQVRLDLAWDLICDEGRLADARGLIREAQEHSFSWKGLRMWLRSLVG